MENTIYLSLSSERKTNWIYWSITAPFLITMLMASVMLLIGAEANVEGIVHLGYPTYICIILGIAKLFGGIAILQNRFQTIKEWAYAGYTFNLLGASASHAFSGDSLGKIIVPVVILAFVLTSYWQWKHLNKRRNSNGTEN